MVFLNGHQRPEVSVPHISRDHTTVGSTDTKLCGGLPARPRVNARHFTAGPLGTGRRGHASAFVFAVQATAQTLRWRCSVSVGWGGVMRGDPRCSISGATHIVAWVRHTCLCPYGLPVKGDGVCGCSRIIGTQWSLKRPPNRGGGQWRACDTRNVVCTRGNQQWDCGTPQEACHVRCWISALPGRAALPTHALRGGVASRGA